MFRAHAIVGLVAFGERTSRAWDFGRTRAMMGLPPIIVRRLG
jgi:hypothetical protein